MTARRTYRVDKFIVPEAAQAEFVGRLRDTHELLRQQPGFIQDFVVEQIAGTGVYNYVTLVEWADQASLDAAKAAIQEMHARDGFDPQAMFERLGIEADLGSYRAIDA